MRIGLWQFGSEEGPWETFDYRNVRFRQWILTFFRETTLQPVPMLVKQPGIFKKFFWLVAIGICGYGLNWELNAFFAKFLSWSANTAVSVQTARILPFPAVTLCNNNPMTTDWYERIAQGDASAVSLPASPIPPSSTPTSNGNAASASGGNPPPTVGDPPGSPPATSGRLKRDSPAATQQTVNVPTIVASMQQKMKIQAAACAIRYENRSIAGHQLCDMVLAMHYDGASLDPGTNFSTWHWNPQYGNCFTFNGGYKVAESRVTESNTWLIKKGGENGDGIRLATQTGDSYGLYLLLNADVRHYLSWTTQIGWRIVIHNQTEMPFPEESGIFVAPGTSTRIGISMNYVSRLGVVSNWLYDAPYSDCIDDPRLITDDVRNMYSKIMEVSYSKKGCLKTCYQRKVMQTCNCFDFNYPDRGAAFGVVKELGNPCLYENTTNWLCKSSVAKLFQSGELECDCPDTCTSYSFEPTISNLKWPNDLDAPLQSVCLELYNIIVARGYGNDTTCQTMSYFKKQAVSTVSGIPPFAEKLKDCVQGKFDSAAGIHGFGDIAARHVGSQFAEVYIFYKDFNYQSIVESEFLELADLLAYMGGILGLFFGFTFLTLLEYLQFVIDLLIIAVGRLVNIACRKGAAGSVVPIDPPKRNSRRPPAQPKNWPAPFGK